MRVLPVPRRHHQPDGADRRGHPGQGKDNARPTQGQDGDAVPQPGPRHRSERSRLLPVQRGLPVPLCRQAWNRDPGRNRGLSITKAHIEQLAKDALPRIPNGTTLHRGRVFGGVPGSWIAHALSTAFQQPGAASSCRDCAVGAEDRASAIGELAMAAGTEQTMSLAYFGGRPSQDRVAWWQHDGASPRRRRHRGAVVYGPNETRGW